MEKGGSKLNIQLWDGNQLKYGYQVCEQFHNH